MEDGAATAMKTVCIRLATIAVAGGVACLLSLMLGVDPLKPTLLIALAALARLAYKYRWDRRD
jgi:hypothetical protein